MHELSALLGETAAEPSPDPELDGSTDSADPEQFRGALPTVQRLTAFRDTVAGRVHARTGTIAGGGADGLARVDGHLVLDTTERRPR